MLSMTINQSIDITPTLSQPIETILTRKEKAMEEAGIGRADKYAALARGLKARKSVPLKDGSVLEEDDIPTQIRAVDIINSMDGDRKADIGTSVGAVNITINNSEEIRELLRMADDVRGQLSQLKMSGKQTGEVIDVKANYVT